MEFAADQAVNPATSKATSGAASTRSGIAIKVTAYIVLVLVAFAMFVPFIFSVTTSLKTQRASNQLLSLSSLFWPKNVTFDAYRTVFDSEIDRWFLNSTIVAVIWVIARAFTATTAGYAFARMNFPGKNLLFVIVLATIMIPGIVTIVPKFLILKELRLLDTYGALTLPFAADAFGIFLMKQFFQTIPVELEEAARVDGAGYFEIYWRIIMPLSTPALIAIGIFTFQNSWNAFFGPLIYLQDRSLYTVSLGLSLFQEQYYTDWTLLMAASVAIMLPTLIVFFLLQRRFIEGVTFTGLKG